MIIELLMGAMQSHWIVTSKDQLSKLSETFPAYGRDLVEIILAGASAVDRRETKLAPAPRKASAAKRP
jgi:hypothetical protein